MRGWGEKRPGTEKRCYHNLQGALLGQRRICAGALKFDSWPVFRCFRKLRKIAISVKIVCLFAFLLVLLSRSEVAKTIIANSFPNGSEASHRGDNPFIHGNPNMSFFFPMYRRISES